jgi:glycolate oxidase iron-sulfur subunit
MMEDKDYIEELSKCVRCGSCKAYCPTYDEGLTEAMGARGRLTLLRGLLCGKLEPSPLLEERIFSCILCGACEKLCPPAVGITEAIYHGRKILRPLDRRREYLNRLLRFSVRRPMLGFRIAKTLQHIGVSSQRILDILVTPYDWAWREKKAAPVRRGMLPFTLTVPESPLRGDRQVYKPERKIGRVALFTGCSTNFFYPHLGMSLINVLLRLGYEVVLPKGEVCCGAPLRGLGLEDDAAELARKNYETFSKLNAEAILSLCPTCIISIKTHYANLTGKGLENAMDVSRFLVNKLESLEFSPLRRIKSATFHDPCHLNYILGIKKEPRKLLLRAGVELREATGEGCCGFGGVFSLFNRDLSNALKDKRVDAYLKTGAEAIVTACPGCIMQLGAGIKDRPVYHIIELVEEAICRTKEQR